MRLLIDNALSPLVAKALQAAGYSTLHVRDIGMQAADDETIFQWCAAEDRVVVSADTDFGTLLALRDASKPSVVLMRHWAQRHPHKQAEVLLSNLPRVRDLLEVGAIVVIERARIRIRRLPLFGKHEDKEP